MSYAVIQPPFTLRFREMSREELRRYFDWFLDMVPDRVGELATAMRESPGGGNWTPDYSRESLRLLGQLFAAHVDTRARTDEELRELSADLLYPIEILIGRVNSGVESTDSSGTPGFLTASANGRRTLAAFGPR